MEKVDLTEEKDELLARLAQTENEIDQARALSNLDEVIRLSKVANRLSERLASLNQK